MEEGGSVCESGRGLNEGERGEEKACDKAQTGVCRCDHSTRSVWVSRGLA